MARAGADEFDQPSRLDVAVEEAELGGGDREIRVLGAEPQIAAERDGEPAADRDAAEGGDRRPVEGGERRQSVLDRVDVIARRRRVAIDLGKFRDVGAGAKMAAGALDDDDERIGARLDRGANFRQRAPHRARDRVAARRAVQANARQRRLEDQIDIAHAGKAEVL